ncbi:MAG: DNA mismatch repair protein MutS [Leptospiraceae bacterium]|nr:MAG: DNA mismatch repair protein MutS [Leptospiraceae bacterium]
MKSKEPLNTPMMKQYLELKSQYPDTILFFRMGDFYELFLDDAKIAAPIMDVALTSRQNSIPMAGVPYHSADIYISRLLQAGKKIAIAEQVADPQNPRLMKRKVVRIITPGTIIEENLLKNAESQYLMAISDKNFSLEELGVGLVDISTGEFYCYKIKENESSIQLMDLFYSYLPTEIIIPGHLESFINEKFRNVNIIISTLETWKATQEEGKRKIESYYNIKASSLLKEQEFEAVLGAISLILHYVEKNFPDQKIDLEIPRFLNIEKEYLILDEKTIKNLNLFEPRETSLYSLFSPVTPKGKRLLKEIILHPLKDFNQIQNRLDLIEFFFSLDEVRIEIRDILNQISDIERILTRMQYNKANPKDFRNIISTIEAIEKLQNVLEEIQCNYKIDIDPSLIDLKERLDKAIADNPPAILGNQPFLKRGVDKDYDEAFLAKEKGTEWILQFEKKEKERTGLSSLKVKFNKVTGYYIEISKVQAKNAPKEYERKQTLINYERFTNQELKEIERKILLADEIISEIEKKYFDEFIQFVLQYKNEIKKALYDVAFLDVIIDFSHVSKQNRWVRPKWNHKKELYLKASRHPIVEKFLPKEMDFIPNDVYLNTQDKSIAIITGPNMAGKSTYIRQVALIQILAQMGCFVPAEKANISIVDRIFTRVGASDNLARGESTFFVEMSETAQILNHFTENSLIIMDEVGRGTSTYDGLSIAWAVIEYLAEKRPKTLFATHYHELTVLEDKEGIFNLTMEVIEQEGEVIFLHKVKEGYADKSYGIHVAKLAGLPKKVIYRAQSLLEEFEKHSRYLHEATKKTFTYQEEIEFKKQHSSNKKQKKIEMPEKQIELF